MWENWWMRLFPYLLIFSQWTVDDASPKEEINCACISKDINIFSQNGIEVKLAKNALWCYYYILRA